MSQTGATEYAQAAAAQQRIDAILRPYAPQVVEALHNSGYPDAYLQVIPGHNTGLGYQTANSYLVHVPSAPSRERGLEHYIYGINEGVVNAHGNPGTTAANIASDIVILTQTMYVAPGVAAGSGGASESNVPYERPGSGPAADQPTGTRAVATETPTAAGEDPPTVDTTGLGVSDPASGTLAPRVELEGLELELVSVAQAAGYPADGEYDGYQIAWFYQRTASSSGYTIGPSELEIAEGARITLREAAIRIQRWLQSAPGGSGRGEDVGGGAGNGGGGNGGNGGGGNGGQQDVHPTRNVLLLGAMILVGLLVMKGIVS